MRKRIALGLAAVLAVSAAGCSKKNSGQSDNTPAIAVQTTTAIIRPIEEVFRGQGILYPIHQASLSPKISAPVEHFYVNRGSHVHAGELLAVLSNQDLTAGVISARGAYDHALANYEAATSSTLPEEMQAAEAAVANAKSNLENQQRIYQGEVNLYHEGGIPRKQMDTTAVALTAARSAYATAQRRLNDLKASGLAQQRRAAKGQMESARGQYLNAVAQKRYSELRSPINGVVVERAVYEGDIAPAGTPLLVVMDTSKVILRLHIPQPQAAQLHVGDAATLDVPGVSGGVPAKVSIISPALDPSSTTVEIWLEANNPDHNLMPGTSAAASILVRKVHDALVIPTTAILVGEDGRKRVMVVKPDSIAYSRYVTTGIQDAGLTQITSGLRVGDQVIVGGAYGLPDKTKVKAQLEKVSTTETNQG